MNFRQLVFALTCWAIAQTVSSARVAVFLTDATMEDKAAVALALLKRDAKDASKPHYERLILVLTGVTDGNKLAQGMMDYLRRAENHPSRPLPADWRERIGWQKTRPTVVGVPPDHERWYDGLQPSFDLVDATGETLAESVAQVSDPSVDIFQIAPCKDELIWDFFDKIPNINIFILPLGYNSRQGQVKYGGPELAQKQNNYVLTLQSKLAAKHPKARVVFAQLSAAFGKNKIRAVVESFEWSRQYFPGHDLRLALYDTSWAWDIIGANNYASLVVGARLEDNEWRHKILVMLKSAVQSEPFKFDQNRIHSRVERTFIPEFSGAPHPSLDLKEAYFLLAALRFLDSEAGGSPAGKLSPAKFITNPEDPAKVPRLNSFRPGDGQYGWALKDSDVEDIRKEIDQLFPRKK
ncbi:hypothetical protein Cob_v008928 [Colletotrichum orbiculare MAFF 240422]|uniref:Uncharacterized protein n=1 Tax=Colletotrichum orbiculare (strain 104-T / ATCC 96160 / CBS 514.97 / LARS 414 / MAFF 240422) TaxID=1213857 RepID=A0A484FJ78_COLOR|nr:hypothetical protein Cob_v008928 [Colletotrichum orbiculare MAFF 240422]